MFQKTKLKIISIAIILLILPFFVSADTIGQQVKFNIDPSYDFSNREQISTTLKKVSQKGYFYLENDWYKNLTEGEREKIEPILESLTQEFDNVIYPKLNEIYGSEWKPGIDMNYTITILFHKMKEKVAGYFRTDDEYYKLQSPNSNEREMLYLNADYLDEEIIKSFIAHEFTHLITFNQKEKIHNVSEEIWLNEARAELAPTLLGYDDQYQGSNLQQRVKQFIESPSDSLTEWQNQKGDYGAVNLFVQYLVDHYGVEILTDSLQSSKVGIESINEFLKKKNFQKDFLQIFTDWTITVFLNNCQFGEYYCYKNENLKNLKISPSLIFLPSTEKTSVSLNYSIQQWAGNWYRVIGGEGDLKLVFDGTDQTQFKVSYILCQDSLNCKINFLNLNKEQKGEILISDFNKNYTSLTLIPSIQAKTSNFSLSISTEKKSEKEKLILELLAQIQELKNEIAKVQAQINEKMGSTLFSCQRLENNLYYGMRNNLEVRCLQQFLKSQGSEIYPQGLVTGNFLSLTQTAVIRFQEKYADAILAPLGLEKGTGFVGSLTRAKLNELLKR